MNRAEKIQLLKDIQEGKKTISSLFKPDLSKLTVAELNRLLVILRDNRKRTFASVDCYTDDEYKFLADISEALRTRPADYGKMMKEFESQNGLC